MFDSKVICEFPAWRIIPGLGYVVTNHGNCKSPRPEQCVVPFQMAVSLWLFSMGGFLDPNCPNMPWDPILRGECSRVLPCYLTSSTLPLVFRVEAPRSPGGKAPRTRRRETLKKNAIQIDNATKTKKYFCWQKCSISTMFDLLAKKTTERRIWLLRKSYWKLLSSQYWTF